MLHAPRARAALLQLCGSALLQLCGSASPVPSVLVSVLTARFEQYTSHPGVVAFLPMSAVHARFKSALESKGYDWLFEVDDDDFDSSRPLLEELEIDVPDIIQKLKWALRPPIDGVGGSVADFWGPISVVLLYAALLVWGQLSVISWVLTIWLGGSMLITFLARVLGADVTFSHTLSSLGYCVMPLVVSRLLLIVVLGPVGVLSLGARAVCVGWATFSAGQWLQTRDLERKRILLVYPILLYMLFLTAVATGV